MAWVPSATILLPAGVRNLIEGGRLLSARRTRKPKLTIGDRLITALMGFIVAFLTMCLLWLLILRIWFAAADTPPPFHWTWIAGLVAAAGGFLFGPERMLDGIGAVWRAIGAIWGSIGDVFYRPGRF